MAAAAGDRRRCDRQAARAGVDGADRRAGDREDRESHALGPARQQKQPAMGGPNHHHGRGGDEQAERGLKKPFRAMPLYQRAEPDRERQPADRVNRHETARESAAIIVLLQQDRQTRRQFELLVGGKDKQREAKRDTGPVWAVGGHFGADSRGAPCGRIRCRRCDGKG
jgi:hypothetical protein